MNILVYSRLNENFLVKEQLYWLTWRIKDNACVGQDFLLSIFSKCNCIFLIDVCRNKSLSHFAYFLSVTFGAVTPQKGGRRDSVNIAIFDRFAILFNRPIYSNIKMFSYLDDLLSYILLLFKETTPLFIGSLYLYESEKPESKV